MDEQVVDITWTSLGYIVALLGAAKRTWAMHENGVLRRPTNRFRGKMDELSDSCFIETLVEALGDKRCTCFTP